MRDGTAHSRRDGPSGADDMGILERSATMPDEVHSAEHEALNRAVANAAAGLVRRQAEERLQLRVEPGEDGAGAAGCPLTAGGCCLRWSIAAAKSPIRLPLTLLTGVILRTSRTRSPMY